MQNPTHQNSAAAQTAVDAFVAVLQSEQLEGFVASFRAIAVALRDGDTRRAIELYESVPVGGMGGLSDVYASDQPTFDRAWSAVGHAFAELRAAVRMDA